MNRRTCRYDAVLLAMLTTCCASPLHAQYANYHVGRDNLPTFVAGTYAGLANPNYQRLALLRFNVQEVSDPASSHWHSIGVYSYSGPVDAPVVQATNANNRIPETFTGHPPLNLLPGEGVFAGKRISGIPDGSPQSEARYDRLTMRSVQELASAPVGDVANYLYHSSNARWNQPLGANARIALQLLDRTEGLHVSTPDGAPILVSPGDQFELGQGDDWTFQPVFWVDASAAPGKYSASLKLVDRSAGVGDSGAFHFDFQVVPEPATALLAVGGVVFACRRPARNVRLKSR